MPRQERKSSSTGIYHVLLRGINQQRIFEQAEDYIQFLDYLYEVKKISGFTLYAYCIMNNHIHLLLKEGAEPLAIVFKRIGTRYAHWFNKKYGRSGHLFQDRFRSEPVENDAYFISVLVYINQNPVKANICRNAWDYEWSGRRFLGRGDGIIDHEELTSIVSIDIIKKKEQELLPDGSFEPMTGRYNAYADKDIVLMMRQLSGAKNASEFQKLPIGEQQLLISRMRSEKVPIRQIARVTGMSKGIVEHWGK